MGEALSRLFAAYPKRRIIVACFASHIHRIQQVANAAFANGRVLSTLGRSMAKNVALARSMGSCTFPTTDWSTSNGSATTAGTGSACCRRGRKASPCRRWR